MNSSTEKIVFHVDPRVDLGGGRVARLRKSGKLVGNVYGLNTTSEAILMDKQAFKRLYETHGDTSLVYLQIGESKNQSPVLIDEVQYASVGDDILNVSFRRVDLSEKIQTDIPVVLTGESSVKDAVVSLVKDTVEVEALPAELPEKFEIDISKLTEIGQSISLADLSYDSSKVTLILEDDQKAEEILLVIVQALKEEVEEAPVAVTDVEITGKSAPKEEEVPEAVEATTNK